MRNKGAASAESNDLRSKHSPDETSTQLVANSSSSIPGQPASRIHEFDFTSLVQRLDSPVSN